MSVFYDGFLQPLIQIEGKRIVQDYFCIPSRFLDHSIYHIRDCLSELNSSLFDNSRKKLISKGVGSPLVPATLCLKCLQNASE